MVKIEIDTHSGRKEIIEVEKFDVDDALELSEKTNDPNIQTLVVGNHIFARIDIKYIGPVKEEEEEEGKYLE